MGAIGKCVNYIGDYHQETAQRKNLLLGTVRSVAVGGGSSAGSCIADGKRIQHCQFIAGKPGGRANGRKQYHGFPQDGSGAGQNMPAGGNAG